MRKPRESPRGPAKPRASLAGRRTPVLLRMFLHKDPSTDEVRHPRLFPVLEVLVPALASHVPVRAEVRAAKEPQQAARRDASDRHVPALRLHDPAHEGPQFMHVRTARVRSATARTLDAFGQQLGRFACGDRLGPEPQRHDRHRPVGDLMGELVELGQSKDDVLARGDLLFDRALVFVVGEPDLVDPDDGRVHDAGVRVELSQPSHTSQVGVGGAARVRRTVDDGVHLARKRREPVAGDKIGADPARAGKRTSTHGRHIVAERLQHPVNVSTQDARRPGEKYASQ